MYSCAQFVLVLQACQIFKRTLSVLYRISFEEVDYFDYFSVFVTVLEPVCLHQTWHLRQLLSVK